MMKAALVLVMLIGACYTIKCKVGTRTNGIWTTGPDDQDCGEGITKCSTITSDLGIKTEVSTCYAALTCDAAPEKCETCITDLCNSAATFNLLLPTICLAIWLIMM